MGLKRFCQVALLTLPLVVLPSGRLDFLVTLSGLPAVAQSVDARKAEADRLRKLGIEQLNTSQFEAAIQSWQEALAIYREISDRNSELETLENLGRANYSQGDYDKTIEYYQQWLAVAREIGDRQTEGKALGVLGNAYLHQGYLHKKDDVEYTQAVDYLTQSLTITREVGDHQNEMYALGNLGWLYLNQQDYAQAIDFFEQLLTIAKETGNRNSELETLENLARANYSQGNYDKTIEYYQQWLAVAREIGDRKTEGKALGVLGNAYLHQGYLHKKDDVEYTQAVDYLTQSLTITREVGDHQNEMYALGNLGVAYYFLGDYYQAIDYLQQSLAIAREVGDRNSEGMALSFLGAVYNSLGNHAQAVDYQQQSLAIAREVGDRNSEGMALAGLGFAHSNQGGYNQVIDYQQELLAVAPEVSLPNELKLPDNLYQRVLSSLPWNNGQTINYQLQSLAIKRKGGDRQGEGNVLSDLGLSYFNRGNYGQAIDYFQQSLTIFREIGDRQDEAKTLGHLGMSYSRSQDFGQAIDYYQQSLTIFREIGDSHGEKKTLDSLEIAHSALKDYAQAIGYRPWPGTIARDIGNLQSGAKVQENLGNADINSQQIDSYEQLLVTARERGNRQSEMMALNSLGRAYFFQGDYTQAIDYLQQHLAITREIGNHQIEWSVLSELVNVYGVLGNYDQALDYCQQWLAIAREIGDSQSEIMALSVLINTYSFLGNYDQANNYLKQHLVITREIGDRQSEMMALNQLGWIYSFQGDYTQGIDYHQQLLEVAKEIGDRSSEGAALGGLGFANITSGNYGQAINYLKQYLIIAEEIGDLHHERIALHYLGAALYKSGNLSAAEKTLNEGIKIWEYFQEGLGNNDAGKVTLLEAQSRTFLLQQKVLVAQNKTDKALEVAELGRARAFVELLYDKLNPKEQSTPTSPSLEKIQQIAQEQNSTLVQYSTIYEVEGKELWHPSELYIWVVKPTGEITFKKVDLKPLLQEQNITLADLVINTRHTIGARDRSLEISFEPGIAQKQSLEQLHQILIEPIAELLPTNPEEHVIFVPQGELFLVPFPALQDKEGKYLVEKHTILTAPAIQVLELTQQQKKGVGSRESGVGGDEVVVVGNPTMPSFAPKIGQEPQQLPSLPGAEREAEKIASLFQTQPLIGSAATETALKTKLSQARIIHFATHGLFDGVQGLESSIALAPTDTDNGLLTAAEILDLKLSADLVVLSACNTGRGRITGDGVIGLSRSLFLAGTPSVVVSLWSVPDAPTAELMTLFYQNLQNPEFDKAQALRQAMLTIMEENRDKPRNWAAFTLVGEAE